MMIEKLKLFCNYYEKKENAYFYCMGKHKINAYQGYYLVDHFLINSTKRFDFFVKKNIFKIYCHE